MNRQGRHGKRLDTLPARIAVFVSAWVLVSATALFGITVVMSRSWVESEQRRFLVDRARDFAVLIAALDVEPEILGASLSRPRPDGKAAIVVDGRWFGAPRDAFGDLLGTEIERGLADSGVAYEPHASEDESLIALSTTINGRDATYYELADHRAWDARRSRTRRFVAIGTVVLAAGAAIAGALAGRRLSRPLAAAAAAARRVAQGGLTTRLPQTDDPALADLTETFNEMVATLAARTESDRRFNSDVSHELRSPLTTIIASLAVLQSRRHELSPLNRTALDLLDADVHRFGRLVDDLLEMSRYDGGAASMVSSKTNVAEFLEVVASTTGQTDLKLVISPMLRVFEIELDKRRIARVITNLVDNAYTHGGRPVWLTAIELPPGDRSPSHVRIAVEDRGPGVDLDRAEELFERFNRGPHQARSDGSGLGLALAREHVRLHGGTIAFEPLPRGITGTCIAVVLPLRAHDGSHPPRTTLKR